MISECEHKKGACFKHVSRSTGFVLVRQTKCNLIERLSEICTNANISAKYIFLYRYLKEKKCHM